ncbi:hypothetical protein BDB00DRAFT_866824 [Zychaea mexicana]|uniref:uncharacterized protein n=1 Tax=Zychaea mexicana TaxID=64656 RepID=UPI0022FE2285|nr:uncharacterized protein BDB00DRAFT_866824 [Zychaea mexicana]KAI9499336.1 hypothetical protein BDB00DRAFT_866824 [Zychaea mexicana]
MNDGFLLLDDELLIDTLQIRMVHMLIRKAIHCSIAIVKYAEFYYRAISMGNKQSSGSSLSTSAALASLLRCCCRYCVLYTPGTEGFASTASHASFAADEIWITIENHTGTNGSFSDQFDRDAGLMQGVSYPT